jgi:hypothetical protein
MAAYDWLTDTFWYVPDACLPALRATNTIPPAIATVTGQTVWHLQQCKNGYITGIAATNIGHPHGSYNLIVGSVTPGGAVKLSFARLGAADSSDGDQQAFITGDGVLTGTDAASGQFAMQMTSGNAASSVTHWAAMMPVTSTDAAWKSLPGYPATGIDSLALLFTPIAYS